MRTLIIHGRQPELGRAELESLYGAEAMKPVGDIATALDMEPSTIDFSRLGGAVRSCEVRTVLDTTDWDGIEKSLVGTVREYGAGVPGGKLTLGLSAYGLKVSTRRMTATGLELKKTIRNTGRPVRLVPNKAPELNSAQILHNKLIHKPNLELILVRSGDQTVIARTVAVQDIEAYAARDRARPQRDAKVGMLPPKLAQIMVNLAAGDADPPFSVYDAFCGTGVILQEALLMGYDAAGSDIDPRMVEYSRQNLDWLNVSPGNYSVREADATEVTFTADCIASEVFLGRPLSSLPDAETMRKITGDCDLILAKFLKNAAGQTKPGFRMCLAVPAWKTAAGFLRLPTLEKLSQLGYNRLKFAHAKQEKLIYHRPEQVVARELTIIERK